MHGGGGVGVKVGVDITGFIITVSGREVLFYDVAGGQSADKCRPIQTPGPRTETDPCRLSGRREVEETLLRFSKAQCLEAALPITKHKPQDKNLNAKTTRRLFLAALQNHKIKLFSVQPVY